MTEREWVWNDRPYDMLAHIGDRASVRKVRLYAHACATRARPFVSDGWVRRAVDLLERSAEGAVTPEQAEAMEREIRGRRTADQSGNLAGYAVWVANDRVSAHYYAPCVLGTAAQVVAQATKGRKSRIVNRVERRWHATFLRDIFGNPFRPITFLPEWLTGSVVALAAHAYELRDFSVLPVLADALQDAGCDCEDVLRHCRDESLTHIRGCWVLDSVLGKE